MKSLKKLFLVLFLLYISGLPNRLGMLTMPVHEVLIIFFAGTGFLSMAFYLAKRRYKADRIDIFLLIILFLYPVISSITAWVIIDQPMYMGLLTFRGSFILLTYYTLIILGFSDEDVLGYTSGTVVFIIILIAILFYIFGINDLNLLFRKGSLVIQYGETTTKGLQFSGFTCLFIIPYVAGWVRFFEKNDLKHLILPLAILLFSVLVSKARNEILTLAALPVMMYYLKYKLADLKFLIYSGLILLLFFVIILTDNVVSRNFSGLLRPLDLDFAQQTGDYSAYWRWEEIKAGWAWFKKYPVTGVGSASYRFNNGYMGFIADFFFIADIGIVGILVKGGLLLLSIYIFMYSSLLRYFDSDNIVSVTGRFITLGLLIELIIGNDFLFNYTGVIVLLFMLQRYRYKERNTA
ncbi:MAG: O-antigen ligase family protein [Bacteroidales bacterium]|nr:O-antigen ligase family protein [Bacteroidales bacterium]